MHKLMVLYPEPQDRTAFEQYYTSTHLPLVEQLPEMLDWRYSLNVAAAEDTSPYFAVFEADFPDGEAMGRALASDAGAAVQNDVPNYATGGAIVLHYPLADPAPN
ncbi:EthD family reductase [Kocuria arenosa]|uniref:EthD family reductase n=1 Tax=Kocuria arenosa TaxID=3071446 RepID=UPI0034D75F90